MRVVPWRSALTVSRTASVLTWLPLVSRIIAALFGGFVLAALCSIAALALPIDGRQAVFTGMLASFLLYAGAVVWVFAVRSAWAMTAARPVPEACSPMVGMLGCGSVGCARLHETVA